MGGYISAAQQVFVRNKCERTPAFRLLQKMRKGAAFDPAEYGAEYLTLSERDFVEELEAPTAAEGWAFGRIVYADGRRSEPGWYPPAFAQ